MNAGYSQSRRNCCPFQDQLDKLSPVYLIVIWYNVHKNPPDILFRTWTLSQ